MPTQPNLPKARLSTMVSDNYGVFLLDLNISNLFVTTLVLLITFPLICFPNPLCLCLLMALVLLKILLLKLLFPLLLMKYFQWAPYPLCWIPKSLLLLDNAGCTNTIHWLTANNCTDFWSSEISTPVSPLDSVSNLAHLVALCHFSIFSISATLGISALSGFLPFQHSWHLWHLCYLQLVHHLWHLCHFLPLWHCQLLTHPCHHLRVSPQFWFASWMLPPSKCSPQSITPIPVYFASSLWIPTLPFMDHALLYSGLLLESSSTFIPSWHFPTFPNPLYSIVLTLSILITAPAWSPSIL